MSTILDTQSKPIIIFECQDSHLTALNNVLRTINVHLETLKEECESVEDDTPLDKQEYYILMRKVETETLEAISRIVSTYTKSNYINAQPK